MIQLPKQASGPVGAEDKGMEKELKKTSVIVRLWGWRSGVPSHHQEVRDFNSPEEANQFVRKGLKFAIRRRLDYLVEVWPKFGDKTVYGSNFGLSHLEVF
jgi:hypothetical protein